MERLGGLSVRSLVQIHRYPPTFTTHLHFHKHRDLASQWQIFHVTNYLSRQTSSFLAWNIHSSYYSKSFGSREKIRVVSCQYLADSIPSSSYSPYSVGSPVGSYFCRYGTEQLHVFSGGDWNRHRGYSTFCGYQYCSNVSSLAPICFGYTEFHDSSQMNHDHLQPCLFMKFHQYYHVVSTSACC